MTAQQIVGTRLVVAARSRAPALPARGTAQSAWPAGQRTAPLVPTREADCVEPSSLRESIRYGAVGAPRTRGTTSQAAGLQFAATHVTSATTSATRPKAHGPAGRCAALLAPAREADCIKPGSYAKAMAQCWGRRTSRRLSATRRQTCNLRPRARSPQCHRDGSPR